MTSAELSSNEDLSETEDYEDQSETGFDSAVESRMSSRARNGRINRITEDQTTENYIKNFDGFFKEMMGKVKSLKNCPALDPLHQSNPVDIDEQKLFKNLKETPEVKEKLEHIKKLDEDIIDLYKIEKAERMQTQLEMCEDIMNDHTLPGKDAAMFLNLCHYELAETVDDTAEERSVQKKTTPAGSDYFIKKNIEVAKEGFLANLSLTDEEKSKIEALLSEEDGSRELPEEEPRDYLDSNGFFFTSDDKSRIRDIDSELEKFAMDEKFNEKDKQSDKDYESMTDFLLAQSIKELESKLGELREKEEEIVGTRMSIESEKDVDILE